MRTASIIYKIKLRTKRKEPVSASASQICRLLQIRNDIHAPRAKHIFVAKKAIFAAHFWISMVKV